MRRPYQVDGDMSPDAPMTPEARELVEWAGPDALVRFRHKNADGTWGRYRRVKVPADGLDEAMRRCAKEFAT
jgi:hypothetical protein